MLLKTIQGGKNMNNIETKQETTNEQVKAVWEETHVQYLGNGMVELTNGVDRCVRKIHKFPEYQRTQE